MASNVQERLAAIVGVMEPFVSHASHPCCAASLAFLPPVRGLYLLDLTIPYQIHGPCLVLVPLFVMPFPATSAV